jgi:hypothetical protein
MSYKNFSDGVKVYLPQNVILPNFDYSKYLVGYLYLQHYQGKRSESHYYSINAKRAKKIYGDWFATAKQKLGTLIENDYYKPGEKSRGYRLRVDCLNQPFRTEYLMHPKLVKALAKRQVEREAEFARLPEAYNRIRQSLDSIKLDERVDAENMSWGTRIVLDRLAGKDNMFSPNSKTGRLFHTLTSLKRECRQYISIGGVRLRQVDIQASQPTLLALLLKGFADADLQHDFTNNFYPNYSNRYPLLPPLSTLHYDSAKSIHKFTECCLNGSLYRVIGERLNGNSRWKWGNEKGKIKSELFTVLFDTPKTYPNPMR